MFFFCFRHSGLDVKTYRYFDPKTNGFDFNGACEDLKVCILCLIQDFVITSYFFFSIIYSYKSN